MAKPSYSDQLRDPRWQKKRLEVMEDAEFCCERCGTDEVTLNVHHKRYVKGRMYWEYDRNELECLCEDCHKKEHAYRELLERILIEASEQGGATETAIGILAGYFSGSVCIGPELAKEAIEIDGHSFHLGILASMAGGAEWDRMARAADAVKPRVMSPSQEHAYELWTGKR